MSGAEIGRAGKKVGWAIADAVFWLCCIAAAAVINFAEPLMDKLWRLRCRLLKKRLLPY